MWELIQTIIAYWPYIVGTVGIIFVITIGQYAYKLGGIPALVVAVGSIGAAVGYYLGQRSPTATGEPRKGATAKPVKRRRPTIFDVGRTIFDS